MNENTKKYVLITAVAVVALAVGAVLYNQKNGVGASNEYVIGFAGPITGPQADYGRSVSQGAQLRVDEINAAGGINGKTIKLLVGDDQATPSQAVTIAQEFASNQDVVVVLGHFNSSCSNAAKPIYNAAKIPQISYGSTNDDIAEGSTWTFRTPYKNSLQGRSLARFAKSALGATNVGIVAENDAYGKSLAEEFKSEAITVGLKIVAEESYEVSATDFRPIFIKLKSQEIDAILLAGFHPQVQAIARQARELGVESKFLAGDGVGSSREYIKNAGESAEGTYATGPFLIEQDLPNVKSFRKSYVEKFGTEPDSWAVYAYDSVGLAVNAIKAGGADREAVLAHLNAFNNAANSYSGVVGPIYFDSNGDAVNREVTIAVVRDGQYEVVEWPGE